MISTSCITHSVQIINLETECWPMSKMHFVITVTITHKTIK